MPETACEANCELDHIHEFTANRLGWNDEYSESVSEFLDEADWIGALERPLAVQLRALAGSLDRQMREDGSVQSAAASQFAQTWARLAKRGPAGGGSSSSSSDPWDAMRTPIPGLENGLQHGSGCACPSCSS